jgi:hypothetical protein
LAGHRDKGDVRGYRAMAKGSHLMRNVASGGVAGQDGFYAATSCRNLRYNPSGWASYVGNDFMPNHAVPSIDYASFHLWPDK